MDMEPPRHQAGGTAPRPADPQPAESESPTDRPSAGTGASVRSLRRLLPYVVRYRGHVVIALVALLVATAGILAIGLALRSIVDTGFMEGDAASLDRALALLLVIITTLAGSSFIRAYTTLWLGERVVADLRRQVYDHVVQLPVAFFETKRTADVISTLNTDTSVIQGAAGTAIPFLIRHCLTLTGGLAMMIVASPMLAGMVALVIPIVVGPSVLLGREVRRRSRAAQDRIADIGAHVDETLHGIRTVRAHGLESWEAGRLAKRVEAAFTSAASRGRVQAALSATIILLAFGAIAFVLWTGGHAVMTGVMSSGELLAFLFYAVVVAGAAAAVSDVAGELYRVAGATERVFGLLDVPVGNGEPARQVPMPVPAQGAITFEGVTFRYPSRPTVKALDDVSLTVEPGESIALVGPSGAGKTTVFNLLLRFYDPQSGIVRMDGVDLRDAAPQEVRQRLSLVPQDPVIFSGTAADNIRYGRPDATDAEVIEAARTANADTFIAALPEGYGTHLGERGVRLSGGQRQRIAIARAILRRSRVLLLDEATSALDAENERLVQNALEHLMGGCTTIVVAHRLATVKRVDRIVVLDQGRVLEVGHHDALVRQGGLYARLAALQFSDVRAVDGPPSPAEAPSGAPANAPIVAGDSQPGIRLSSGR